jgi:hypothetical protein
VEQRPGWGEHVKTINQFRRHMWLLSSYLGMHPEWGPQTAMAY